MAVPRYAVARNDLRTARLPGCMKPFAPVVQNQNDDLSCRVSASPRSVLALLTSEEKQHSACSDRNHTVPGGNVDRLLLFHRQLERSDLHLVRLLGEAKTAIQQTEHATDDESNAYDFGQFHVKDCS